MTSHSPKKFTLSVQTKVAAKYGLRDKNNDRTIDIKSPYKNITLTAVFDKLIDAYAAALYRSADDENLYCWFTTTMERQLRESIALLAQIAENQNNAIAALSGSQGASLPTHSMEFLSNTYDRLDDKNILWLYKEGRFDIIKNFGYVDRLLELKPDAVLPEPANTK